MKIFPAVDLYEGRVVRLEKGDYQKCKVYSENPLETAKRWVREGARWLHVVDLEGARSGKVVHWEALREILGSGAAIQWGGGVRSLETIEKLTRAGVKRVILGTKALDPGFLQTALSNFGERIALSLDLRGEDIQIEGWQRSGSQSIFDFFKQWGKYRPSVVIVTDIERDGTLGGIDLPKIERILEKSPCPVIISGGVSSLDDIGSLALLKMRIVCGPLEGVIVGKALYEGKLNLREALIKVHSIE